MRAFASQLEPLGQNSTEKVQMSEHGVSQEGLLADKSLRLPTFTERPNIQLIIKKYIKKTPNTFLFNVLDMLRQNTLHGSKS